MDAMDAMGFQEMVWQGLRGTLFQQPADMMHLVPGANNQKREVRQAHLDATQWSRARTAADFMGLTHRYW